MGQSSNSYYQLNSRSASPAPSDSSDDIPLSLTLPPTSFISDNQSHSPAASPPPLASNNPRPLTLATATRSRQKRPAPTSRETRSQKRAKGDSLAKSKGEWRSHRGGQKHQSSASKSMRQQLVREDLDDTSDEEFNPKAGGEWSITSLPAAPPHDIQKWVVEKVARIANARECNLDNPECPRAIKSLRETILGECHVDGYMFQKNDLQSLALRCQRSTTVGHAISFIDIVNRINFACKVDRYVQSSLYICSADSHPSASIMQSQKLRVSEVHERWKLGSILNVETFSGLVQTGMKFARLAASGKRPSCADTDYIFIYIYSASIYFIIVVILCRKRYMLGRSNELHITALSNALRDPSSCTFQKFSLLIISHSYAGDSNTQLLISQRIIPLLSYIRQSIPLSFATMFSSQLLKKHNLPNTISCHDLSESDSFFDAIRREYVNSRLCSSYESLMTSCRSFILRDRDIEVWKEFTLPLPPHISSASLHTLNRQLLVSTPSSSSHPTTRAPSPCSDSDDERGIQPEDSDSGPGVLSQADSSPCEIINIDFDFAAPENRRAPYAGVEDRVAWDLEERSIAEGASRTQTFEELREQVCYLNLPLAHSLG